MYYANSSQEVKGILFGQKIHNNSFYISMSGKRTKVLEKPHFQELVKSPTYGNKNRYNEFNFRIK